MPEPSKSSQKDAMAAAFQQAVQSFQLSMPLIMHGSGDVAPQNVDQDAAKLVASLTAEYIASLADAALGVQLLQSPDGQLTAPPPRFRPNRITPVPPLTAESTIKRKRPRSSDDYWDAPLPEPKIKNQTPSATASDAWVGLAGCDLSAGIRAAHVTAATALSTQAFLFPICHDAYAYGRVTQLQASKRSMMPLLTDASTMELVRTEGALHKKKKKKPEKPKKKKDDEDEDADDEDDDDNESTNSDEEEGGPVWPGLNSLLPSYHWMSEESAALEPNADGSLF